MSARTAADAQGARRAATLAEVQPVVRAILARKSGMSLADDDARPDNLVAIELYHDVVARLWERLATGPRDEAVRDFKAYAAMVAYNAWSDHLREKYPERTSLKQAIRYFLGHQPKYALWQAAGGETVGGPRAAQVGGKLATAAKVAALKSGATRLPAGSVPTRGREQYKAADWDRLLAAVFAAAGGGGIELDDLVGIVGPLVGLAEAVRVDPVAPAADQPGADPVEGLADEAQRSPEALAELRDQLALLWRLVSALKLDYRRPYLMNPPAADGTRGEIDVWVAHGLVRLREIAVVLALTPDDYARLWPLVPLADADRAELAGLSLSDEYFAMLYKYLPASDEAIGAVMQMAAQQVINRRNLALKALRAGLAGALDRDRAGRR